MNFKDNENALHTIKFVNATNKSIFLTGKAGTGKTTLLRNIVLNTHKKTIIAAQLIESPQLRIANILWENNKNLNIPSNIDEERKNCYAKIEKDQIIINKF